ncbi:DoxX family protein [Nitratireductor sp. ZSWI3]|uniref:DoxX family protein n=1 Tax=Nitratireductor sp. ZSWI3 TaxID=2966359 RepID=UPI00215015F8|nr:DoxX family protein [Nitratireductor sp. ZSWI3]MCR4265572.1 DoxX family protein [Nitratireductor sp. ZSWI3]
MASGLLSLLITHRNHWGCFYTRLPRVYERNFLNGIATMSQNTLVLIGRILISVIFITSGFSKLTNIGGTAGYFGSVGLPLPLVTAWIVALLELLGGLAILVGFQTRIAALLLALFSVASALVAHFDFGDQMQSIQFMKNLAIAGGLLILTASGSGTLAVERAKA